MIIGKNIIPLEPSVLKMLEQFGFKQDYAEKCLNNNKHNQVTTIYYLLHRSNQLPNGNNKLINKQQNK